jgi:hypothetical protein
MNNSKRRKFIDRFPDVPAWAYRVLGVVIIILLAIIYFGLGNDVSGTNGLFVEKP